MQAVTVEVLPQHRFDEAALARYLAEAVGTRGDIGIRQFQGGQSNPTFLLETSVGRLVLRKKPPGVLLPSAHQIEREWRIISALHGSEVPVPRPVLLCEDAAVIGTPFYVMEHVAGRVIPRAEAAEIDPAERRAMFAAMAETMAALHRVDWQAAGLEGYGRPENYLQRQVERWGKQYRASIVDAPDEAMERLMEWLPAHMPAEQPTTIAHGDFRIGNLIFADDAPRILAVLDWELSTLGDPLGDLAYCCLPYHLPVEARGYQGLDLDGLGIPLEAAFLDDYCRRTGRTHIADWPFYLAFSLFRLAGILHGIYARALKGNASSANALEIAGRATLLSSTALELAGA